MSESTDKELIIPLPISKIKTMNNIDQVFALCSNMSINELLEIEDRLNRQINRMKEQETAAAKLAEEVKALAFKYWVNLDVLIKELQKPS
jgi:uncharacterized membrane protein YqgA involved in biofilm formation